MFDIGWQELFVIAAVGVVIIGPKDLPRALAQMTKYMRKARSIAREFQGSIDEVVRQAELEEIRKEVEKSSDFDLENEIRNTVDPTGEIARDLDLSDEQADLEKAAAAVVTDEPMGPPAGPAVAEDTKAPEAPAIEPTPPVAGPDDAADEPRPADPANSKSG